MGAAVPGSRRQARWGCDCLGRPASGRLAI